jgi:hypothetical protein
MTNERTPEVPGGISEELRPYVDRGEASGINEIGERLSEARPVPRAGFRSELAVHLRQLDEQGPAWRPAHLGRLVAAYAGSGLILLLVTAIGLAGAGPFAN